MKFLIWEEGSNRNTGGVKCITSSGISTETENL